MAFRI